MESVETAKVRLEIEDKEAKVTLESLKADTKEINKELRALKESGEVGSEAWKILSQRQRDLIADMKEFNSSIDINDASMNELNARYRQLNTELNRLKVGSKEWLDKLEEVNTVKDKIDEVKTSMKGVAEVIEETTNDIDLNNASLNELSNHYKKLVAELNDLKVGTQEWLDKAEEVNKVKGIMEATEKAAKDVGKVFEETANDIDLNNASLNELSNHNKKLVAELNELKVGTQEWLDKAEEVRKIEGIIDDTKIAIKGFGKEIDLSTASFSELQNHAKKVESELHQLTVGSQEWLEKLNELDSVNNRIESVGKSMKDLGYEVEKQPSLWENMKTQVFSVFTGVGLFELAKEATSQMFEFGREVFDITAKFEKYEAVLKSSLGSQKEASEALEMIQIFAAKTNFSVDELTESYIKMANRDLRPNTEQLMHMADVANATGKDMGQLVEAIMDINNTERWNEIGIKAQTMGDKVSLTFKGQTEVVARTEEGVMKAMDAFGQMNGVMGMTAEISATLEGRTSNLGDNYDTLKRTIGESLKPVFDWFLEALNIGIETSTLLVKALFAIPEFITENIGIITGLVVAIGTLNAGNIAAAASALAHAAAEKARVIATEAAAIAQRALNLVLAANPIGAVIAVIAILAGAFMTWYDRSEKVKASIAGLWQALKSIGDTMVTVIKGLANADFSGVAKAFSNAGTNASLAFGKGYNDKLSEFQKDKETKQKEIHKKEVDDHGKHGTNTGAEFAKKHKAERDKLNEQIKSDNQSLLKKVEEMQIKSIVDETQREIAQQNLDFKREKEGIEKSLASQKNKEKALESLQKNHVKAIEKINAEHETKEKAAKDKKDADDKASREKTASEEKKLRDERLKAEKALFDAEFSAEVAKARNVLDLTKTNSQAQWNAKRNLLEIEWKYKQQQLRNEAEAEKARIAESIIDTEQRRVAMENIDAKLKAKLSTEERKFQEDKTKLNEAQNKAREENNKKFFDALNSAMSGDFLSFVNFLADKVKNDKSSNEKQVLSFTQKTQQISDVALQGINTLKQLNQKFLESQLEKIKSEKDAQIASWQKQYDSGKIDKTKFEAERDRINKDAAAKELKVRKDAFEREKKMNIAAAAINTAQAALKSFAMFGWPIGAIMAALAAVAGGLQIAAIKRQQFSGEKGGVINSLGKIFAQSGSVIPKNAFVAKGDRHGSKYGEAGISMINRSTGEEVGEIEGGEPVMVLSRNTKKNNGPIIDKLLHSSLYKNGAPITMANGGVMTVSGKRMFEDGGVVDNSAGAGITPESSNAMMEESRKSAKDMAEIKQNTAQMRDLMKGSTQEAQKSKFAQLSGNAQIANIASTFYDVLKAHGTKFDDMRALLKELKELVRSLDDSSKGMIKRHDEAISQKVKMYNQKLADQKAWRADEQKHKLELMMLQRYIYAEMQKQGKTLEEIRDKPTGADLLHTLDRIAANTSKSNLK